MLYVITKCHSKTTLKATDSRFKNVFEEKTTYLNEDRTIFNENLNYLNRDPNDYVLFHNLKTKTNNIKAIEAEFLENYEKYHAKKKKYVVIEHFKISISPEDRLVVMKNPAILLDLAAYWLEIYAPECLGYATLHFDKPHLHAHIIVSGNLLGRRKQNRKSQKEFKTLQWQLELYKRQKYPFLNQRDFYQKDYVRQGIKKTNAQQEMENRWNKEGSSKTSRKEEIQQIVKTLLLDPSISSKGQFMEALKKYGLKFYERGQVSIGVLDTSQTTKNGSQRKFRLNTLGVGEQWKRANENWGRIQDQLIKESQKFQQRLSEIHSIRQSKARIFWKERGVMQAIQATYNGIKNPVLVENQRLAELQKIRLKRPEIAFDQERPERSLSDLHPTKQ